MTNSASAKELDSLDELQEVGERSLWILSRNRIVTEDVDQKVESKERDLSKEEQRIQELTSENETLKSENEELSRKLTELNTKSAKKDSATKSKQMKEQITSLEREIQVKQKELDTLKTNTESQLAVFHKERAKKDADIESLRNENTAFKAEIDDLKGQLQIKQVEKKQLTKEVEKLNGQLLEIEQNGRDVAKTKQVEIDRLTAEIGDLKKQLQIKNTQVKEIASTRGEEKEQLAKEAESLKGELLVMQQTRTDEGKTRQAEIDRLTREIGDLQGKLQIKNAQVEDLSQLASTRGEEKERLEKEAERLKGELLVVQQTRTDDGKTKQAEIGRLTGEIRELKRQLQSKNVQFEELNQLANTRGEEKKQLTNETEQLQGQLLKMQRVKASLTDDNETKQAEIDQLTERLASRDKEMERQTREIEQFKQDLACAQENIAELMGAGPGAKYRVGIGRPDTATATPTAQSAKEDHTLSTTIEDRTCPVCQAAIPGRVSQDEFERHVNSHFN